MTRPNPVDRGKTGSKIHVLSDRRGLPLSVAVSAANTNDANALKPLVRAIPAVRSRRGPRRRKPGKLHADKAYDHVELRRWVRERGIGVRITRKGIESSHKLGQHRWVIERTIAWLFSYHRLSIRYDRYANHFCAFLTLAAALTCYKKLAKAQATTWDTFLEGASRHNLQSVDEGVEIGLVRVPIGGRGLGGHRDRVPHFAYIVSESKEVVVKIAIGGGGNPGGPVGVQTAH